MLVKKEYPLNIGVLTVMLSVKLRVEKVTNMAKDLIQRIIEQCDGMMKAGKK